MTTQQYMPFRIDCEECYNAIHGEAFTMQRNGTQKRLCRNCYNQIIAKRKNTDRPLSYNVYIQTSRSGLDGTFNIYYKGTFSDSVQCFLDCHFKHFNAKVKFDEIQQKGYITLHSPKQSKQIGTFWEV